MIITIALVICAITAALAARKGYNPACWFFAAGIIGLLILAFLPFVNKGDLSEEEARSKRNAGNIIGAVISVIAVVFMLISLAGR
jgi:cytochrome bd-type quinol oxidase subunit 2